MTRSHNTATAGSTRTLTFGVLAAVLVGWYSENVDHLDRDVKLAAVPVLTGVINFVWTKVEDRWPQVAWLRPKPERQPRPGEKGRRIRRRAQERSAARKQAEGRDTPVLAPDPPRMVVELGDATLDRLAERLTAKKATTPRKRA